MGRRHGTHGGTVDESMPREATSVHTSTSTAPSRNCFMACRRSATLRSECRATLERTRCSRRWASTFSHIFAYNQGATHMSGRQDKRHPK
jgi:hypothetical protein